MISSRFDIYKKENISLFSDVLLEKILEIIEDNKDDKGNLKAFTNNKDKFVYEIIYNPYMDIINSLEHIEMTLMYINRNPSNRKISKSNHLKYFIGSYWEDIYILEERLLSYCTKIYRVYKKTDVNKEDINKLMILKELVLKSFKEQREIRRKHVHKEMYNDYDITELSLMGLATEKLKDRNDIKFLFQQKYSENKKYWREIIDKNIIQIIDLLDIYFKTINKVVIKNKKINLPNLP